MDALDGKDHLTADQFVKWIEEMSDVDFEARWVMLLTDMIYKADGYEIPAPRVIYAIRERYRYIAKASTGEASLAKASRENKRLRARIARQDAQIRSLRRNVESRKVAHVPCPGCNMPKQESSALCHVCTNAKRSQKALPPPSCPDCRNPVWVRGRRCRECGYRFRAGNAKVA
jgi:hypothetical protein